MPRENPTVGSAGDWLRHAESDLSLAHVTRHSEEILIETLCFHAQQTAEKALKAVLVFCNIEPPKTHSIGMLTELLPSKIERSPDCHDRTIFFQRDGSCVFKSPGDFCV